jgi:hypothetical protein
LPPPRPRLLRDTRKQRKISSAQSEASNACCAPGGP